MGVPQGPIRVPLQKSCHQSCFLGDIIMLLSLNKDLLTEKEEAYTLARLFPPDNNQTTVCQ